MRRAAIERQAIALRSSTARPGAVLDAVVPGLSAEPRLIRTRALEVAVEAALDAPGQADGIGAALREGLESGPPLTTREIELLLPLAREQPRALANCVQPLLDVLAGTDEYDDDRSLVEGEGPDRRAVAAATVLVAAVSGAPGLFQGAVPTILELADTESAAGRRCLWLLARLSDAEPATVRPVVADAVWTIEDKSGEDRIPALDRLATLGRVRPTALPDGAVSTVASVAADAQPAVRVRALCTLAAIGGRPSESLRRHAIDFDDIDDLFLGGRPGLTDELVGAESTPPGTAAPESLGRSRAVVRESLRAEDPDVARAAQDAAIALGRESPAWLRSHSGAIRPLVTADAASDRQAAASLLQRAIPGAPAAFLDRAFAWLRELAGNKGDLVCQRAVAALGTLLSEVLDRSGPPERGPSPAAVWGTLLGRYLTGSGDVRELIADAVEPIDVRALPPAAVAAAVDGLLSRAERIAGAQSEGDDDGLDVVRQFEDEWSVDGNAVTDLLGFAARLLEATDGTDRRLARLLDARLDAADADTEELFDLLAVAEPSLRRASVPVDDRLEAAYYSEEADDDDDEDRRREVLDTVRSLDGIDPTVAAAIVEDAVADILAEESPYRTTASGVRAVERVLLNHPPVAERVREELLETVRSDDGREDATARLVATAYLAAPPRDRSETEALAALLATVDGEPTVETWLAAALVVVAPADGDRRHAVERLRSLRVRGDPETFGNALGTVRGATGSLPAALTEPLLSRRPRDLLRALERPSDGPRAHQPTLEGLLRRLVAEPDPEARAGFVAGSGSLPAACRSTVASEIADGRALWFLTGDRLESALRWRRTDEDRGDRGGGSEAFRSALAALETHPAGTIRELAGALAGGPSEAEPASGPSVRSAYRAQPPEDGPGSNGLPAIDSVPGDGPPDAADRTDRLVHVVRHGGPDATVAGLEAIRRGLDRGAIDWQRAGGVVTDHLTDRWRIVRRTAAQVLLRATWAGVADPDRGSLADRLTTDEATGGVLAQVLVATAPDPEEWPAPGRVAPVLVDLLLGDGSYSERHAAGRGLRDLVAAAPALVRETVVDGMGKVTDGEGDTLAAAHLLAAFDDLVDEHGYIADEVGGYLETVLTSDSVAGVPTHDDGRTLGAVPPEAARPVDGLAVYRTGLRIAAHGGLRAYRGVLDPPPSLPIGDVLTVDAVASFLRNASDDAVQDIGVGLVAALGPDGLAALVERWVREDHTPSPAVAVRRVTVVPLLARAIDDGAAGGTSDRPEYVDAVVDELTAADAEVRVAAVTALSELTALGDCHPDELVAHLLGRADDPSGWVRKAAAEALAEHAPAGNLPGDRLHGWAAAQLASPRGLRPRTAAMLLGALGAQEPSLRRQCLDTAATALPTGRAQLDDRLANAIDRLLDRSPVLEESLDAETLARLDGAATDGGSP